MKKIIVLVAVLSLLLAGCGGGTPTTSNNSSNGSETKAVESAKLPDLSGVWASEHNSGETSYQVAVVDSETITIYWYNEEDKSSALYWAGSYTPPTSAGKYAWDSANNKEVTDSALLASGDDSKTFTYENDIISYSASAMGVTKTMKLLRDESITGIIAISPSTGQGDTKSESSDAITEFTLGDVFEFDNLEITFGTNIEWHTLDNEFSDKHGADVFSIPIKVKNISDETHGLNMFYYSQYGSKGTKLDGVSSYFDNDVDSAGKMRASAESETLMYFLYDGDGDYYVEFEDFSNKVEVKVPVKK